MGNIIIHRISFEDIQFFIKNKHNEFLLINTLPTQMQECLIVHTISSIKEEEVINTYLTKKKFTIQIIIYGKNANDESVYKKYKQLQTLGFCSVYVYCGGLFEWLLLQDIYGDDEFPTTKKELDILKYRPQSIFNQKYLRYSASL